MIHPDKAGECDAVQLTVGIEASERNVMGGLTRCGAFLTYSISAMDDGRFEG